ncbi:hypothetical protein DL765_003095 [Monosporascus sp. GIB2]|nr:hypothetical protein DL765_003095 [Monosporascus sp. GIB2]
MSENETSPLLRATTDDEDSLHNQVDASESSPLLSSNTTTSRYDGDQDGPDRAERGSITTRLRNLLSPCSSEKKSRRWASGIAIALLSGAIIAIIILAFILPDTIQEYAQQAAVIEPTKLSLDSITPDGVRARIQANFRLDGSRVENEHVRRLGRAATWVAYQLGTEETEVVVYLPEYDNVLLGSAVIPPLVINLREGDTTKFDFVAEIKPGNLDGVRTIANEWLDGRLKSLRLRGKADLSLRSGLIPLANKIPAMPKYNITRLNVADGPMNGSMVADVSLSAFNTYPIQLDIPELAFDILLPGCTHDDLILVADAITSEIHVEPQSDVHVDATGVIRELPESLTSACPDSSFSPLDMLLKSFMHGDPATLFVRGSERPDADTPKWIAELLSSVTLPVPFPGRSLDGLIRNFSLTDVHFTMPDPFAEPGDPDADPKVSGTILVTAGVPSQMNFGINVTNVRARADVLYKTQKMGELNLRQWQHANSTRVEGKNGDEATLRIESRIEDAPLNVTDSDVFSDVLQALLFGDKAVELDIDAAVDIKVVTALGTLVVKDVPAQGKIPVKPLPKGSLGSIAPKVNTLKVLDTTPNTMTLQAIVNVTNPTSYTAHIPYANIHILHNDTTIGDVSVENLDVVNEVNDHVVITATWNPSMGGEKGQQIGRDLISQYLSGYNTTLTVKAHRKSIPGQPVLCEALSRFNATFSTPRLGGLPSDEPGEGESHFIRDATFHLLSSTAIFTLVSPLEHNTVYLDFVNATALYNHSEPVGRILYDLPFAAPPGQSRTPRLPVDWSVGSVGYDAILGALGGKLRLDAFARVNVRLGNWRESLWYRGRGIGASVKL